VGGCSLTRFKATPDDGGGQGVGAATAQGCPRYQAHEITAVGPSTAARQARLAWGVCLLVLALVLAKIPYLLPLLDVADEENPVAESVFHALGLPFAVVGALIAARRPSNRIGWLLLVGALSVSSAQLAWTYVLSAHYDGGRLIHLVGWLGNWLPWPALTALILLLLLFPNGRLLSRRWRPVAWAAVTWCAATMVFMALYPDLLSAPQLHNPIGLSGRVGDLMRGMQDSALLVGVPLALVLLAALSLILRFRRSAGVERQQLKWFAYVVGLAAANLVIPLYLITDWLGPVTAVLHWLLLMSIAGAIGLAILRYRLYDIDRIISRTLVYGLLTGLLGLVYAGLVLSLGQLFGGISAQPPSWAVAGATLAVAALFQPLRRRIQQAVDRRFNRRRYDAAQTIEAFSVRLREEVDLDALSAELLAVVEQTMQPTTASLWLRPSARRRTGT
jgi:hypothetical protein